MQINWLKNVSYNAMYDDNDDDDEIQSLRGTLRTEKRSECAEWLTAVKYIEGRIQMKYISFQRKGFLNIYFL